MIAAYLDHLAVERGHSRNTLSAYRGDVERYRRWLEPRRGADLSAVTGPDLAAFVADLSGELSARSVARVVSTVRGLHRFALAEGVVDVDASADVPTPKTPLRLPKAITVEDVEALLSAAAVDDGPRGLRDVAMLEFLYGTGARVSEAVGADVDDVDAETGEVVLRGKGGRTRVVPVGGFASRALSAYLVRGRPALRPRSSRLFLNARGGPLTRQGAHLILTRVADVAGLPPGIGPHTLRHSFATHLVDGGADVRVVQELLGHASVTTTQIYTLVTVDRLREVYATTHPRAR